MSGLALIDEATGRRWTHAELEAEVWARADALRGERSLVFCRCRLDAETVLKYLAARRAGHAVALLDDRARPETLTALEEHYRPQVVLHPDGTVDERRGRVDLHPDLALLLPTSGTTGSPKLVRLSAENLRANAASIASYLEIGPDERAIASLPFHYSYGLSVLNSHLLAGAAIVIPREGIMRPAFWDAFERYRCTSFAGVPYSYAVLERSGWGRRELPTLRTMTQAGGALDPGAAASLHARLAERGARFVVMYGQTEATARIAFVPPERLADKPGSIGVPIPGGELWVQDGDGRRLPAGEQGELVYRGPNVMLGYATGPADLAAADELGGVLATGDLGYVDDDGFFFVTGRLKRIAKVYGVRLSLDDIEARLRPGGPVAAVSAPGEQIRIFVEGDRASDQLRRELASGLGLSPRTFDVREIDALPVTGAGKIDYAALERAA
jgi:acyl-coenzyme A synthetase/AMP-(fatty) acid ligase